MKNSDKNRFAILLFDFNGDENNAVCNTFAEYLVTDLKIRVVRFPKIVEIQDHGDWARAVAQSSEWVRTRLQRTGCDIALWGAVDNERSVATLRFTTGASGYQTSAQQVLLERDLEIPTNIAENIRNIIFIEVTSQILATQKNVDETVVASLQASLEKTEDIIRSGKSVSNRDTVELRMAATTAYISKYEIQGAWENLANAISHINEIMVFHKYNNNVEEYLESLMMASRIVLALSEDAISPNILIPGINYAGIALSIYHRLNHVDGIALSRFLFAVLILNLSKKEKYAQYTNKAIHMFDLNMKNLEGKSCGNYVLNYTYWFRAHVNRLIFRRDFSGLKTFTRRHVFVGEFLRETFMVPSALELVGALMDEYYLNNDTKMLGYVEENLTYTPNCLEKGISIHAVEILELRRRQLWVEKNRETDIRGELVALREEMNDEKPCAGHRVGIKYDSLYFFVLGRIQECLAPYYYGLDRLKELKKAQVDYVAATKFVSWEGEEVLNRVIWKVHQDCDQKFQAELSAQEGT